MAIRTVPLDQVALKSLDAVSDWIGDTQKSLRRIPLAGVLEHGATFRDDEYLGDGDALFHFNQQGFQSFCQRLGFRMDHLARLETPALATQVLNDLMAQRQVRELLANDECVVDERTGTIIGLVSSTYLTYSNREFIEDVSGLLAELPEDDRLTFREAYGINTELTLRFTSVKRHGTIRGRGGEGEDKSELGLEFRNSMVGTSSVRINYFLHRLICANGLMIPAAEAVNRVFHSGRKDTFHERLSRRVREVVRHIGHIQQLLETLGRLNFEPDALASTRAMTDAIFDVIPGSKQAISEKENVFLRYPQDASATERERIRRLHDARMIGLIPEHFGGAVSHRMFASRFREKASLFDFINVFTEHAKSLKPVQKLDIEENAGTLANYIANHARML